MTGVQTCALPIYLQERIRLLFDEEKIRFAAVINAAGELDGATSENLQQAADSLEAAR